MEGKRNGSRKWCHDSLKLVCGIKSSSILISNTTQIGLSSEFGVKTFV